MEDKILRTTEEFRIAKVKLINNKEINCKTKITYTYWASGRKDCAVELEKPLGASGLTEQV